MSDKRNLHKRDIRQAYYPDGLTLEEAVDILLRNESISSRLEGNQRKLPGIGIVREILKTNNLSLVNNNFAKDNLITEKKKDNLYIALVEIEDKTETFEDYKNNIIDRSSFIASLVAVYVDLSKTNNRIPVKHEKIILEYEDEENYTTAKFGGYPSTIPVVDENLLNAVNENSSARDYYPRGA